VRGTRRGRNRNHIGRRIGKADCSYLRHNIISKQEKKTTITTINKLGASEKRKLFEKTPRRGGLSETERNQSLTCGKA